jgi:hypothetical protein
VAQSTLKEGEPGDENIGTGPGQIQDCGACDYEAENGQHQFATVLTTPKALHDLIVDVNRSEW